MTETVYKYNGEPLFRYTFQEEERLHTLTLRKTVTLGTLRRFISDKLMTGTVYSSGPARELASAIFMAVATPSLQFSQYGNPRWVSFVMTELLRMISARQKESKI